MNTHLWVTNTPVSLNTAQTQFLSYQNLSVQNFVRDKLVNFKVQQALAGWILHNLPNYTWTAHGRIGSADLPTWHF